VDDCHGCGRACCTANGFHQPADIQGAVHQQLQVGDQQQAPLVLRRRHARPRWRGSSCSRARSRCARRCDGPGDGDQVVSDARGLQSVPHRDVHDQHGVKCRISEPLTAFAYTNEKDVVPADAQHVPWRRYRCLARRRSGRPTRARSRRSSSSPRLGYFGCPSKKLYLGVVEARYGREVEGDAAVAARRRWQGRVQGSRG